jgi:hypothetical protein
MRIAVAAALLFASSAHAGGVVVGVPPVEVDFGSGPTVGSAAAVAGPSTEILVGAHWASLAWKPTSIDVGIGYIGVGRDVVPGYEARTTDVTTNDNRLRMDGAYLDVAYTIERHTHWRTWLAGRAEYLHVRVNDTTYPAAGCALRIATELFAQGVGIDGGGGVAAMFAGTLALGIYVEASHRDVASELGPNALTAGLSLRVPFVLAAAR